MDSVVTRLLFGTVLAVCGCTLAMRIGDKPERRLAALMLGIWLATTVLQFLMLRDRYTVAVVAQCAFAFVLLWMAATHHKAWMWFMIAASAVLMLVHAVFYRPGQAPYLLHLVFANALVWGAPVFLAGVALYNWNQRRARTPAIDAATAA